jgi:hypothetical protein
MLWNRLIFWPLIGQAALLAADVGSVLNQWQIRTLAKHATPLTKPQGSFVHTQSLEDQLSKETWSVSALHLFQLDQLIFITQHHNLEPVASQ